jgi:hypothetical protein
MRFTSFAGTAFSSLNVTAHLPNDTPDRDRRPEVFDRLEVAGKLVGVASGIRSIPVYFQVKPTFDIETTILALIAALDPDNPEPRALVGQLNDGSTNVQVMARVGSYIARPEDTKGLLVTFYTDDARWTATSATTVGPDNYTGTATKTFTVGGQGRTIPLVKVGWSVNRASSNSLIGWTYAREIVVTNNSAQALHNYPIQLGPINSATLVAAGKLQSDNDDLVVFNDRGERLRRATAGTNTRGTFLWFVVDELAAGASRTYTVAYGNPSASHSTTNNSFPITYPGSPVIDTDAVDGQATAATSTTLSTGTAPTTNKYIGATMLLVAATGAVAGGQYRRIASNTNAGVYTVTRAFSTTPDTNTGYVIVGAGFMGDGGVVSSASATTLNDTSQSWHDNEWIGATVEIITLDATIGTVTNTATGTVTSNTSGQLVVAGWGSGTPSAAQIYRVYKRNANWIYRTELIGRASHDHRGRWLINTKTRRPSQMWFAADGAPAAWSPTTYNPNNAAYDYNQPRATTSSGEWFAALNARLARKDGARLAEEGFANGVELSCPLGILGVKHDYGIENPDGMARAVFGAKERGGEDWELYHEYGTEEATLTSRPVAYYDLTSYGTPQHLLAALTSDDDADVDKTETGTARLREGAVLEVRVDPRNLSVTRWEDAAEHEVYDVSLRIRRGGASEAAGDDLILVGGDEHHLFLKSTETVWVGPLDDWPLVTRVYDGATYDRDVPNSVEVYHVENDSTGDPTRYVSSDVLPLTPGSTSLRIADPDGTWGTMSITIVYDASYL